MTIIVRVTTDAGSVKFTAPNYRAAMAQLSVYKGTARIYCKSGDGVALVATVKAGA